MREIAAREFGWRPPDTATPPRERPRLSRESICSSLAAADFDVEQIAEFTYVQSAGTERAWLSVPIFTKDQLPGLSYQDRMHILAHAYARLGPGRTDLSRWVIFTARGEGVAEPAS